MNRAAADLVVRNLRFRYAEAEMAFDMSAPSAAIVAVMGASGSGKSTLLSLIAGFEQPSSGAILIGGRDVTRLPPAQRPVSMVFQENNLFGHLDVFSNVGLGRSPALRLSEQDRADVLDALARTGLSGKERRLPRELSGGERQRAALARALVRDRPVLLLDEPFASLGPALRRDMLDEVRALHGQSGMTVLMATHHPEDAQALADQIVFLENGRVAAQGPAASFFGAEAPAAFVRYMGA